MFSTPEKKKNNFSSHGKMWANAVSPFSTNFGWWYNLLQSCRTQTFHGTSCNTPQKKKTKKWSLEKITKCFTWRSTTDSKRESTPTMECWMLNSLKKQPWDIIASTIYETNSSCIQQHKPINTLFSINFNSIKQLSKRWLPYVPCIFLRW